MVVVDKSFIIASVFYVRDKFFSKRYVTCAEVDYVKRILLDVINKSNSNIEINDDLDYDSFTLCDRLFLLNDGLTVSDLKDRYIYVEFLPVEVLKILWNEEFICQLLLQYDRGIKFKNFSFEPTNLGNIIDSIVSDSKDFYSKVAGRLSEVEFEYFCSLIEDKNCSNCENKLCDKAKYSDNVVCEDWKNSVLVGKSKVLRKL